ncbi:MAG: hypothetical protein JSV64_00460 [Candidatus Bathyarchaeota archaeon]|nr:MAG: hypothetical protein JSV64_00460 [Candidatus Bathyarchaeota archaeon]
MYSIEILTINADAEKGKTLIGTIESAKDYFPSEAWDDIRLLGELQLDHHLTISSGTEDMGAFLFRKLLKKIKEIKKSQALTNLVLGVTDDPVIAMHYYLHGKNFKKAVYVVHDYVNEKIGLISFFRIEESFSSKVVAHGLGHHKRLQHHVEPIDLMYSELLKPVTLQIEGFCDACVRKLTDTHSVINSDSQKRPCD